MVLQSRSSLYIRHGFPNSRYIAHFECGFQFIHIPSLFLEDKSGVGMIDDKMQEYHIWCVILFPRFLSCLSESTQSEKRRENGDGMKLKESVWRSTKTRPPFCCLAS